MSKGETGVQGTEGAFGLPGFPGDRGPKGPKGSRGPQGKYQNNVLHYNCQVCNCSYDAKLIKVHDQPYCLT